MSDCATCRPRPSSVSSSRPRDFSARAHRRAACRAGTRPHVRAGTAPASPSRDCGTQPACWPIIRTFMGLRYLDPDARRPASSVASIMLGRIGDAFAGDVERGAVIDRRADDRQAERDVHRVTEREQLHGNQSLIVIAGDHRVELAPRRAHEHGVAGQWPVDRRCRARAPPPRPGGSPCVLRRRAGLLLRHADSGRRQRQTRATRDAKKRGSSRAVRSIVSAMTSRVSVTRHLPPAARARWRARPSAAPTRTSSRRAGCR